MSRNEPPTSYAVRPFVRESGSGRLLPRDVLRSVIHFGIPASNILGQTDEPMETVEIKARVAALAAAAAESLPICPDIVPSESVRRRRTNAPSLKLSRYGRKWPQSGKWYVSADAWSGGQR
jgi:hypothetical protein